MAKKKSLLAYHLVRTQLKNVVMLSSRCPDKATSTSKAKQSKKKCHRFFWLEGNVKTLLLLWILSLLHLSS